MKVKIAVAQYRVPQEPAASFKKLNEIAVSASFMNVKLLVVPETAIGSLAEVKSVGTDYLPELQKIALNNRLAIATSFYQKDKKKYYNQGYLISAKGEADLTYRKIYLAAPERDQDKISGGSDMPTVSTTAIGKIGMIICKDGFNKFSHYLYEGFNVQGAEIICVPTWSLGWDEMDTQEYIKTLYTYGSFISRSFVLVAGNLNMETKSFGRSLIISPIRGVINEGSIDKQEILVQELDLDEVYKARQFDLSWQPKERIV